jgi:tRNA U38,U39,U40 pseudouridine synthase TruA
VSYPAQGVRYASRVMYDGTGFTGWQFQSKARTVQGVLERAVNAGREAEGVSDTA